MIYVLTYSQLKLAHCYVGCMQEICFQRSYAARRISEAGLQHTPRNKLFTWYILDGSPIRRYLADFRLWISVRRQISVPT